MRYKQEIQRDNHVQIMSKREIPMMKEQHKKSEKELKKANYEDKNNDTRRKR